jgi:hypothetical protein
MNALLLVPPASPVLAVQNGAAKLKPSPFEEASVSRQCCRFNQACEAIANRQNFRRNFARFLADKLQEDNQLDSSDSRALVHTIASGQHLTVPALKDYVRTPGAERSYKYEREKIHLRQCPFCGYLIHLLREIENENLQNDFGRKLQLRLPVLRRHAGQAITHREVHRSWKRKRVV